MQHTTMQLQNRCFPVTTFNVETQPVEPFISKGVHIIYLLRVVYVLQINLWSAVATSYLVAVVQSKAAAADYWSTGLLGNSSMC